MYTSLVPYLVCPACQGGLEISDGEITDGKVEQGTLSCRECSETYPIRGGIPRFVAENDDYASNFGFQWQQWRDLQIDKRSGHTLSETRFLKDGAWPDGWLEGKVILDAGCGAGRFADIALKHGATVIAVDLSNAVEACRDVVAEHGERGHVLQASLFDLPIRPGSLDGVYCMGVLQHTPDPMGAISALPGLVKPGGRVVLNFYEEGLWRRLQLIKYGLRLITPHIPMTWTLGLSKALVAILFPVTKVLSRIPKIRILNHFIPIASVHDAQLTPEQQKAWTLLDTFDWYGPKYELCLRHNQVRSLLQGAGLAEVASEPGLAWARIPPADQGG